MKSMNADQALTVINQFFAKTAGTHTLNDHFALMQAITTIDNERIALKQKLNERAISSIEQDEHN